MFHKKPDVVANRTMSVSAFPTAIRRVSESGSAPWSRRNLQRRKARRTIIPPRHVVRKKTCFAIAPRDVGVSPPDCGGERRVASRVPRLAQQLAIEGGKCTQGSGGELVICSKTATNCFAHGSNTKSVI